MQRTTVGTLEELAAKGCLTGKLGSRPVCVFWVDGTPRAVDDRCPHMGFPLHRGSVENGLLTCHWHHARFDLISGGTLDPFADDVTAHDVEIAGDHVVVVQRDPGDPVGHLRRQLARGLELGLVLVMAKSVLGLMELTDGGRAEIVEEGARFGLMNRQAGWGTGLTVLTAMANVLPSLAPEDRALALVHGLAFVSNDTRGRPPRFPLEPLDSGPELDRLASWYRRFIDTRNGDAAERVLATAALHTTDRSTLAAMMGAAVTDHVFLDGGHAVDFTNKALELLDHLDDRSHLGDRDHPEAPPDDPAAPSPGRLVVQPAASPLSVAGVLTSLAQQTAAASRSEEGGAWRHPVNLAALLEERPPIADLPRSGSGDPPFADDDVDALAWDVLGDDPAEIIGALDRAGERGGSPEQLARAVAYAAALRLTRFHIQNDHGDWDVVHHGFTAANALHQLVCRAPTPELVRGVYQLALKVYLDRFLNVPPARLPHWTAGHDQPDLDDLHDCWDRQGQVDRAAEIVHGWIRSGGSTPRVTAVLGHALLHEDAGFHWYQTFEASVRQAAAWPEGSEQQALILCAAARFLAAHTPTRRELPQVVTIATRLRRGEELYEEI